MPPRVDSTSPPPSPHLRPPADAAAADLMRGQPIDDEARKMKFSFYEVSTALPSKEDAYDVAMDRGSTKEKEEGPKRKNVYQFYVPADSAREGLNGEVHKSPEVCSVDTTTASDASSFASSTGGSFKTRSVNDADDIDGDFIGDVSTHDGKDGAIQTAASDNRHIHQFYHPPASGTKTTSLTLNDYSTRVNRAVHLSSLNASTMATLELLQAYHRNKRTETTLLEKYGFRS